MEENTLTTTERYSLHEWFAEDEPDFPPSGTISDQYELDTSISPEFNTAHRAEPGTVVVMPMNDEESEPSAFRVVRVFNQNWRKANVRYAIRFLTESTLSWQAAKSISTTLSSAEVIDTDHAWPSFWRGVFTVNRPKKVIFDDSIEFSKGSLRRWKPRITIDRRTRELNDD